MNITGITTISDRLQVTSGISTFYDTTQSTSATTGAVIINGGVGIAKNVNIGGNLTVTGTTTFNGGTITLGDADTDNVVFSADVDSSITPDDDDTYDLGSTSKEWRDLHIDGIAHLDNIEAGIGTFSSNLLVSGISTFTGNIDANGDLDVDGTANLDIIDVDGTANFASDVTLVATGSSTIHFDASNHDLTFGDNIRAKFGTGKDLVIYHDGTASKIENTTGDLNILSSNNVKISHQTSGEDYATFNEDGAVELFFNGAKIFQTTGAGVTVGLSSIQHNGNAAFPGITTLGKPGAGSEVIINNRLTVNSGANISGIATLSNAYITKLAQSNGTSGNTNEVPVANGSGGWNWAPVNTAGASDIQGITVQEEGSNVGTAGSINTINFTGSDITASASGQTATVNVSSNIQGITTSGTSFLHDITQTGVTTITSDQAAAFNVGTAATIYSNGNVRTTGVITAFGGFDVGAGTTAKIFSNGNANFSGIVTAGSGFNIGIQSAGIVIANNVGINTLNFVGSGNSITYFPATNTLDVSIAGSSGGGGGVSETSTSVSSTSATSCGSFAKASKRSASVLAQITQGSAYQVGRYLVIHDGTTVTTVEESAVATGSMLGTFEGVINGNDVEFRVTMSSSSSATVITKIDSISS